MDLATVYMPLNIRKQTNKQTNYRALMILSNCKLDDLKDHRHFPSKWLPENIILSNTKFIFSTFPNNKTFSYPKCPGYHGSDLVVNSLLIRSICP